MGRGEVVDSYYSEVEKLLIAKQVRNLVDCTSLLVSLPAMTWSLDVMNGNTVSYTT
jgi:hypothetical protein